MKGIKSRRPAETEQQSANLIELVEELHRRIGALKTELKEQPYEVALAGADRVAGLLKETIEQGLEDLNWAQGLARSMVLTCHATPLCSWNMIVVVVGLPMLEITRVTEFDTADLDKKLQGRVHEVEASLCLATPTRQQGTQGWDHAPRQ
jgi:hypothetical protein